MQIWYWRSSTAEPGTFNIFAWAASWYMSVRNGVLQIGFSASGVIRMPSNCNIKRITLNIISSIKQNYPKVCFTTWSINKSCCNLFVSVEAGIMSRNPLNSKCINGNDSLLKFVIPVNGVAILLLRVISALFSADELRHAKGFINWVYLVITLSGKITSTICILISISEM